MKPFRTNKKDRATFARVMGWEVNRWNGYVCNQGGATVFSDDFYDGRWEFVNNGFQRTVAALADKGVDYAHNQGGGGPFCELYAPDPGDFYYGFSPLVGEALFRAVVAMGEAQK